MKSSTFLAVTGLAAIATATPVAPPQPQIERIQLRQENGVNATSPCAQASQAIWADEKRANTMIPAKIAYDCLNSIPLNVTSAKRLLDALPVYIQWQSTLVALKNPPSEYSEKVQPPIDILGGLDKISSDIDAGKFKNEYQFGWALYTLIQSAHDGHFGYIPDSVGGVFSFGRTVPLVSVSEDGKKLPSVFAFHDVLGMQYKNISYTPSAITKIDGQDVSDYLEALSQYGSLQDRDALYNNVFYELAQISLGSSGSGTGMFTGGGRGRFVYPGPTTTLKFENGSSYTMQNFARPLLSFRNITSGEDVAKRYFYFGASSGEASTLGEAPEQNFAEVAATPPGYPEPIQAGPGNLINGFFIDAPGYEDVAVLQVPNFVGSESAEIGFQRTTKEFLPKALAAGKTKLIIDLQANGGGTILQGYDLFRQLFPSIEPVGVDRFRATESLDLIGQSYSSWASKIPRVPTTNGSVKQIQSSYFDYHSDLTVDGENFQSWDEKFGPQEVNGDAYTTPSRWNVSDVHITWNSGGINITGYGPLANESSKPTPFEPENVVILTDGYCASTCTIFSEFMTKQAGVKTIALGGRSNKNQIQAIGGVKGTNNYQFAYIQNLAKTAISLGSPEEKAALNSSVLRTDYYNEIVFNRVASPPGVNVRDGLQYEDDSGVALQFIYEEADCRLYYTPEMTVDITAVWRAAADAQWGEENNCVSSNYGKRTTGEATKKLQQRRVKVSSAVAMQKVKAFEDTFGLSTQCHMKGDGFMHP
ncbi:hypothetical protein BU24DRAFT_209162 [Aaosphaeria arxii CBS 175.79]|uniref:Uncharacterized protein n=1 Tax=Aaosphaeria arxii CBS 175.79 TaxID=1450172 RepID=A0A6A5XV85_9PLEO|nr:uncharacterized protein BU24DRAFT_209162 [Aaosphaeria arxii CBS 175.79]KAF2016727.1 hypothetical protein BU24DRAFT_209162 [Aaosphaeria arxii CBS 175.79]